MAALMPKLPAVIVAPPAVTVKPLAMVTSQAESILSLWFAPPVNMET